MGQPVFRPRSNACAHSPGGTLWPTSSSPSSNRWAFVCWCRWSSRWAWCWPSMPRSASARPRRTSCGSCAADVDRSSELIKRATHDGMLLNRKEEVQATIERLAQGPEIAAIRVYDKEGAIVMSAQPRGNRPPHRARLRHLPAAATSRTRRATRRVLERTQPGARRRRARGAAPPVGHRERADAAPRPPATPIRPTSGCWACSTWRCRWRRWRRPSARHRRQFLWTTLILVADRRPGGGGVHPPRGAASGACSSTRARGGSPTATSTRASRSAAATSWPGWPRPSTSMAGDLSAARREVTEWSQKLEEKVVGEDRGTRPGPAAGAAHGEDGLAGQALGHRGPRTQQPASAACSPTPGSCGGRSPSNRIAAEVREELTRYLTPGREGVQPLRRHRAEPAALLAADRRGDGAGRPQRGRRAEPDARAAPPGDQRAEAAQRAARRRQPHRGRRRPIAAGPGRAAGQRRRGDERAGAAAPAS